MKKLAFCVVVLASLPTWAAGNNTIVFRGKTGTNVVVYRDSTLPQPRCLCDTFRVLVTKPRGVVGNPFVSEVDVEKFDARSETQTDSAKLTQLTPLNRNPWSPTVTKQVVFERKSAEGKQVFRVNALREKCLNPTQSECKKLVVEVSGVFNSLDLSKLKAISPSEAAQAK